MTEVLQQLINGLSLGGTYALLALGLAVVFSIFRLINFAHGDLMTVAGYVIYFSLNAGVPYVFAALLGIAAAVVAALLMERIAFRPLRSASVPILLLSSLAVSTVLELVFQDVISPRPETIQTPAFLSSSFAIGSLSVPVVQMVSIGVTVGLLVLLTIALRHTTLGIAMRAAAENFPVLRLMGIKANYVIAAAFALSGALAGVAAIIWTAQLGSVEPTMGQLPMFKAFIAAILGGAGSLRGAVVGGFALGFIEVIFQAVFSSGGVGNYQTAIIFLFVIVILVWRPEGLVGGGDTAFGAGLKSMWRHLVVRSEM